VKKLFSLEVTVSEKNLTEKFFKPVNTGDGCRPGKEQLVGNRKTLFKKAN